MGKLNLIVNLMDSETPEEVIESWGIILTSRLIHWYSLLSAVRRQSPVGVDTWGCAPRRQISCWCFLLCSASWPSPGDQPWYSSMMFLPQSWPTTDWSQWADETHQISSHLNCVSQVIHPSKNYGQCKNETYMQRKFCVLWSHECTRVS